jgi:hypothetical protein
MWCCTIAFLFLDLKRRVLWAVISINCVVVLFEIKNDLGVRNER